MKNIEALMDAGGDVSMGPSLRSTASRPQPTGPSVWPCSCDNGEKLNALMKRLDKAIGLAWSDELIADEVHGS